MSDENLILRVASRGDGVTADGRYVTGAAPGDRIAEDGGLIHGDRHQEPPCQHSPLCGGCQLQHLDEEALSDFVRERAVQALATQGVEAAEIMPTYLSTAKSRRRAALRAMWVGKEFHLGFSTQKSHRIIDLQQCEVMTPELFSLLSPLRDFLRNHTAKRDSLQIKMAMAEQGIDLLIENWVAEGLELHEALTKFASDNGLARLSIDEGYGPTPFWEPEPVTVKLGNISVTYPPFGFIQAAADAEAALISAVQSIVGEAAQVADLFSGLGTFSFCFKLDQKVYAAEADRQAVQALQAAANTSDHQVFSEHRDLFRRPLTSQQLHKFGAVILDPPRAGAKEQSAQLAQSDAQKIAYVSCNPNSFARDAKTLVAGGYRLNRLWTMGQFRWSTHIEMVGEFLKE